MIADLPHLQKLSGLKQPAAVKRWLRKNGVPFMVQADGAPVTTLDAISRAMYGGRRQTEPDFDACARIKSMKRTGATTTSTKTSGTSSAG